MKLYDHEINEILDAMRDHISMEHKRENVIILVDEGGGKWKQDMICGAVVHGRGFVARKWCRSLDELMEFLEVFA